MIKLKSILIYLTIMVFSGVMSITAQSRSLSYPVVDTGQETFFNNSSEINTPSAGDSFYGQDAQYNSHQPSYTDNGDGTITDNVTGLMWSKSPDLNGDGHINASDKLTYEEALSSAETFNLAGYNDWRLPTIKELYSLIQFSGKDVSGWEGSEDGLTPFINTDYFDFGYGDVNSGERLIDAQMATSTKYVGSTMFGDETMFGVNFADGRIKGYGIEIHGSAKTFYVYYVKGNTSYGINKFSDNNNGTITDSASGLMWAKQDNGEGLNWQEALEWVQEKNDESYLGYSDWYLPNAKELQSIVDYSRSPSTTNSAAIDPLFECSAITDESGNSNYPFYWSSTTHETMVMGDHAAYVCFGEALGWMQDQMGNYQLLDVHGAGAQRSDPKVGNPDEYPYGHGPQGDVVRINNYVRLVRDASNSSTETGKRKRKKRRRDFRLDSNYPNPFNPSTTISFTLAESGNVSLEIFNAIGERVAVLVNEELSAGNHSFQWNVDALPSGFYFYNLKSGSFSETKKMLLVK